MLNLIRNMGSDMAILMLLPYLLGTNEWKKV